MAFRGILGLRGRRADRRARERGVENDYESAVKAAGQPTAMENEALAEYRRDPMADLQTQTSAQWAALAPQLDAAISRFRGGQVGRGESGWVRGGEDEIVGQGVNTMANNVLQQSLWAAGQRKQNANQLLEFGTGMRNQQLGLATDRMDRLTADRNERSARRGSLLTAGLGIAGSVLGGPIGGAVAGRIGQAFAGRGAPGPALRLPPGQYPRVSARLNPNGSVYRYGGR